MSTLGLVTTHVNHLTITPAATGTTNPAAIKAAALLLVVVLLVWAVRQLRPAIGIVAELVRMATRALLASVLVIGAVVLLVLETVVR